MKKNVFGARKVLRTVFGTRLLRGRSDAGLPFWYYPAEYPSLILGIKRFERDELPKWRALLRSGDTIFDVGANIGLTAHRFYGILEGSCSIVAFEPIPHNADLLERNAATLGTTTRVDRSAVGDREGTITFIQNLHHGALSMPAEVQASAAVDDRFWESASRVEVPTTTLDAIIRDGQDPPDVVKIDVEGSGHLVLAGASDLLRRVRPLLLVSLHNTVEGDGVRSRLAEAGYIGVMFDSTGSPHSSELPSAQGAFVHPDSPAMNRIQPGP